jgi:hypothetical protein
MDLIVHLNFKLQKIKFTQFLIYFLRKSKNIIKRISV